MRILSSRPAAALALAAALSLGATPALADGWGGHRHRHHRGIDGGDVLAGVLILGGIAAIASAAGKGSRDMRERDDRNEDRYPDQRDPEETWRGRSNDGAGYAGRGESRDSGRYGAAAHGEELDRAVDACVAEVERGDREVDAIDAVRRSSPGWTVEGRTGGGRDFTCSVDADGHVRSASVDGRAGTS